MHWLALPILNWTRSQQGALRRSMILNRVDGLNALFKVTGLTLGSYLSHFYGAR